MTRLLLPLLMLLPLSSFAETSTYEVSGMTCGVCVKAVQAQVCKMEGVEKCDITVGKVVLSTKSGVALDAKKVSDAVERAGYKVTGSTSKK